MDGESGRNNNTSIVHMDIQTVIEHSKHIPSAPQILPKLQKVLRDENSMIDDIINVIKVDGPLTAQILRISNSALFGGGMPNENLSEAVNRLGYQEIYKVVGSAVAKQTLGRELVAYAMPPGELWERSVVSALMMEIGARHFRTNPDTAYTIGLLHSIGKIVVNNYYIDNGIQVYSGIGGDTLGPEVERQILGFDHAEAGGALLQHWDFSDQVYSPIKVQFSPLEAEQYKRMSCLIHLASWAANWLRADTDIQTIDLGEKMDIVEAIGLTNSDFRELLATAKEKILLIQADLKV